jgi:hypothetical protein
MNNRKNTLFLTALLLAVPAVQCVNDTKKKEKSLVATLVEKAKKNSLKIAGGVIVAVAAIYYFWNKNNPTEKPKNPPLNQGNQPAPHQQDSATPAHTSNRRQQEIEELRANLSNNTIPWAEYGITRTHLQRQLAGIYQETGQDDAYNRLLGELRPQNQEQIDQLVEERNQTEIWLIQTQNRWLQLGEPRAIKEEGLMIIYQLLTPLGIDTEFTSVLTEIRDYEVNIRNASNCNFDFEHYANTIARRPAGYRYING